MDHYIFASCVILGTESLHLSHSEVCFDIIVWLVNCCHGGIQLQFWAAVMPMAQPIRYMLV